MAKKRRWSGARRKTRRNKSRKTSWKAFSKKQLKAGHSMKAVGRMWRGKKGKKVAANPRKRRKSRKSSYRRRVRRNTAVAVAPNKPRRRRKSRKSSYRRRTRRNAGVYRYQMSPVAANRPRRRRKSRKSSYRRRTRRNAGVYRYQMSPVAANPFARNAMAGTMGFVKETVLSPAFWTETIAPLGLGFFGARIGAYQIANLLVGGDVDKKAKYWDKPYMKALWQGGTGVLGGVGIGLAFRSKPAVSFAAKLVAGSLVSSLLTLLEGQDMYRKVTGLDGFSGLGADISSDLKKKISASIQKEIAAAEGINDFVSTQALLPATAPGMNDFVTVPEVPESTGTMTLDQW